MSVKKKVDSKGKAHYHAYAYDSKARKQRYLGSFDRERDADADSAEIAHLFQCKPHTVTVEAEQR